MKSTSNLPVSLLLAATGLFSSTAFAYTPEDIRAQHCSDCGSVLVGAARIDHKSIQWVGSSTVASLNATVNNGAYGFTGDMAYQDTTTVPANTWLLESSIRSTIGGPAINGLAPSIGFFFAPSAAGSFNATATYQGTGVSKTMTPSGVGMAELDPANPALTFDVELFNHEQLVDCSCVDPTGEHGDYKNRHCQYVQASLGTAVRFTLTPRYDINKAPVTADPVSYVMMQIVANEVDTPAQGLNFIFRERFPDQNSFDTSAYIHHLHPLGPPLTGGDIEASSLRTYPILMSVNKSLQMLVGNSNDSGTGYIEYSIALQGHSDYLDKGNYPGSNRTYRIVTTSLDQYAGTCEAAVDDGKRSNVYNISTRALVSTGQENTIAGFIIQGTGSKKVLLKATGRSLNNYGVQTSLDPSLRVYRVGEDTPFATNDNWQDDSRSGEIPSGLQPADSSEAALVLDLEPGAYTAVGAPVDGTPEVGLVSVDDLATDQTAAQLINISTRALVDDGQNNAIAGVIFINEGNRKVLLKGIGKGLTQYGITTELDAFLSLYKMNTDGSSTLVSSNDSWSKANRADEIPETLYPDDITDAALVVDLEPGSYTAILSPASTNSRGVGLISMDLLN